MGAWLRRQYCVRSRFRYLNSPHYVDQATIASIEARKPLIIKMPRVESLRDYKIEDLGRWAWKVKPGD